MPSENVLKVGDKAPQFTLEDHKGNNVKLKDFLGEKNVVLIFYPGDMTAGCTIQLSGIRDHWPKFSKTDSVVFGVNHGDAKSHTQFIKKYSFPFPLLVDTDKKVSKKYGAVKKLFSATVIKRTVVVINKKGEIDFYKHGMPKEIDIIKHLKK